MNEALSVRPFSYADAGAWDAFVNSHSEGALYHLSGWREVIEKTYGHKTYYLIAEKRLTEGPGKGKAVIEGILPLVHLKHMLFGNSLISMPFVDDGGILAGEEAVEAALLSEAAAQGKCLGAERIELRHAALHSIFQDVSRRFEAYAMTTSSHKVRMVLDLPETSEALLSSFKAKLRSQIKKPQKEGLRSHIGGSELLDDFYTVFAVNMRDLGSPVHSKAMIGNTLQTFEPSSRICLVYQEKKPVAGGIMIGFKGILRNLWASSLREYAPLSPNMLLYWAMLSYACEQGYISFDFGRSTPEEGTYKFKAQWGALPIPLYWHDIVLNGKAVEGQNAHALNNDASALSHEASRRKGKFDTAMSVWKKLPVPVTKVFGPLIRKHIGL